MESEIITGLDIGTTKVCAVIGQKTPDNDLIIVGVGTAPCHGLKNGVVINIDKTVEAIYTAIEEAELQAGIEVDNMYVGIGGSHISGENKRGVVAISNREREVTVREVDRVVEAAQSINLPSERDIIHVIPYEFIVDDQKNINHPIGMVGVRLEANVHIITGNTTSAQNIFKCVNRAGFDVKSLVLQPLASAEAVLTDEEKEVGVVLLDIGGGTSDIVVYQNGSIRHTSVIPFGGNIITHDIAHVLGISLSEAEKIKIEFGSAISSTVHSDEIVDVISVGNKKQKRYPRHLLCKVIEKRITEILRLVYEDIKEAGLIKTVGGGIVMTGGTSQLFDIAELTSSLYGMDVRVGNPNQVIHGLIDRVNYPEYSTAVGLVIYGYTDENDEFQLQPTETEGMMGKFRKKVTAFFNELFQ